MSLVQGIGSFSLRELAQVFDEIACEVGPKLDALAHIAKKRIPGAASASLTQQRGTTFVTLTATDEIAERGDQLQYDLGSGPCVNAITDHTIYAPTDLRHDDRWPEFGTRVSDEVGVNSMLSYRLAIDGIDLASCLNVYGQEVEAFDDDALAIGLLIATHASAVMAAKQAKTRADNLAHAVQSNREIGVAMGVLMSSLKLTREQAFDLLRITSQNSNRKLSQIATEVADTGALTLSASRSWPKPGR